MPCYSISTASIKLKAENVDLLRSALGNDTVEGLSVRHESPESILGNYDGYSYEINRSGEVITESSVATKVANAINRAYSREVIRKTSRKFGWTLKSENDSSFVAVKRGI